MDEPLALDLGPDRDHVARCAACHHRLRTEASQALGLGPDCASKLGIHPRRPVRIAGSVRRWDCDGQLDLLEDGDVSAGR